MHNDMWLKLQYKTLMIDVLYMHIRPCWNVKFDIWIWIWKTLYV